MQIRDLEARLGLPLVERRPNGVCLTAAGRDIAERAAGVMAEVRDLTDFAKSRTIPLSGDLSLGVIPSIAPYLLPSLLPLLRQTFPELTLNIHEAQTDTITAELLDGRLDLLLLALPIDTAAIDTLHLFDDPFLLAAPKGHNVPHPARCLPDLLQDEQLLLLEEGHCLRDQALAVCALRNTDRTDTFGASTLATLVQMVANGMGFTLLPEMAVQVEGRSSDIDLVPLADPVPSRSVGLAWRKSSPLAQDFAAFGDVVKKARKKA